MRSAESTGPGWRATRAGGGPAPWAVLAASMVAAGIAVAGLPAPAAAFSAPAAEQRCHRAGPEVSLTFDDGGRRADAASILDTLAREGVRAGFFPTGDWARQNPDLVARMLADGHWVGNHTGSHTRLGGATEGTIRAAVAAGVPSSLLRPPYGSTDDRVRRVAASAGYRLCLWTVDPTDWRSIPAAEVVHRTCTAMAPGGVAVLHLQAPGTVAGLSQLIRCLRDRLLVLDPLRRHAGADYDPRTGPVLVTAAGTVDAGPGALAGRPPQLAPGSHAVGVRVHPSGAGYWVVGADGGVFAFGAAPYLGSTGGRPLNSPVVSMAPTPSGLGYWLVAADGGVFAFGDAPFLGSTASLALAAPVVSMAPGPGGADGYWLLGADGGVFAFGRAPFRGASPAAGRTGRALALAGDPGSGGYVVVRDDGSVQRFPS